MSKNIIGNMTSLINSTIVPTPTTTNSIESLDTNSIESLDTNSIESLDTTSIESLDTITTTTSIESLDTIKTTTSIESLDTNSIELLDRTRNSVPTRVFILNELNTNEITSAFQDSLPTTTSVFQDSLPTTTSVFQDSLPTTKNNQSAILICIVLSSLFVLCILLAIIRLICFKVQHVQNISNPIQSEIFKNYYNNDDDFPIKQPSLQNDIEKNDISVTTGSAASLTSIMNKNSMYSEFGSIGKPYYSDYNYDNCDYDNCNYYDIPPFFLNKDYIINNDFKSSHQDELTLYPGDIVQILQVYKDGWVKGKNKINSELGYFPYNVIDSF